MDLGVISVRYARALLKSALRLKQDATVYEEMQSLLESFLQLPQLHQTITNPMLDNKNKLSLLETACGGTPSELTSRFLQLVLKEGRVDDLQFMAASYTTLYRRQKNIICGKLTTAVAVSAEIEDKMRKMVEEKTHGTVEFKIEVDPDILGGFILEYDTYRMDASVRTGLKNVLTTLRK
jgi:ATP synthase F1, delta subunit